MSKKYFNRYLNFIKENKSEIIPFIKLPEKSTDTFDVFNEGKTRFDKLSESWYGSPYFDYLIMLANPEMGGLQHHIPEGTLIRIPFPLDVTLRDFKRAVDKYKKLYD